MEREGPEHLPEERLEAYALDSLSPDDAARIEEHLLFCVTCQNRLEGVERYARAMQAAAKRIREEHAGAQFLPGFFDHIPSWLHKPLPVFAGAVAMAAVILMVGLHLRQPPGSPVEVELYAVRGTSVGTAPAGHALHLRMDSRGVPELSSWRVAIVDEDGTGVWTGTGISGPEFSIKAEVNQSFRPGTYFVRLLKDGEDPVREYQLVIQKAGP